MENNELDAYTIFSDMTFVPPDHKFVEATKPVYASPYLVGQYIAPDQHTTDFASFFFQNMHLILFILSGYVSLIIFALAFSKTRAFSWIFRTLKLILSSVLYGVRHSAVRKLAILLLFFSLFMFNCKNFLQSSIKTEKTAIKTDEIINSPSKLFSTTKLLIVNFEEDSTLRHALEHSFLGRLVKRRRFVHNIPIMKEQQNALIRHGLDTIYFFSSQVYIGFTISFFAELANKQGLVAYVDSQIYSESPLRVLYLRGSLDEETKKFIHEGQVVNHY